MAPRVRVRRQMTMGKCPKDTMVSMTILPMTSLRKNVVDLPYLQDYVLACHHFLDADRRSLSLILNHFKDTFLLMYICECSLLYTLTNLLINE